jgi:hypothetical protein
LISSPLIFFNSILAPADRNNGIAKQANISFFFWNNLRLGGGNKATIERFFGEKA